MISTKQRIIVPSTLAIAAVIVLFTSVALVTIHLAQALGLGHHGFFGHRGFFGFGWGYPGWGCSPCGSCGGCGGWPGWG